VQRLRGQVTVWPPMMSLRDQSLALAESVGRAMAWELRALGLNVSFAPVLDVHTNPANPIIGDRAFGTAPDAAVERALAYLRGLESEPGLRGCGKHFPGHGDTETDSHLTLPVVRRDWPTLEAVELLPFRRAISAGIGMLMTAHVVYPAIDERPATLSRKWLHDVLRTQLGYTGLVVSDDLDMKAVTAEKLGIADDSGVVVESLLAGCDAFLFCQEPERLARAEEALIRAAERSATVRDRIAESAARLATFRRTLGDGRPVWDRLAQFPVAEHLQLREQLLR
jgi:beta-N-acetylhexosaminidase